MSDKKAAAGTVAIVGDAMGLPELVSVGALIVLITFAVAARVLRS